MNGHRLCMLNPLLWLVSRLQCMSGISVSVILLPALFSPFSRLFLSLSRPHMCVQHCAHLANAIKVTSFHLQCRLLKVIVPLKSFILMSTVLPPLPPLIKINILLFMWIISLNTFGSILLNTNLMCTLFFPPSRILWKTTSKQKSFQFIRIVGASFKNSNLFLPTLASLIS